MGKDIQWTKDATLSARQDHITYWYPNGDGEMGNRLMLLGNARVFATLHEGRFIVCTYDNHCLDNPPVTYPDPRILMTFGDLDEAITWMEVYMESLM